ncbi:hypothetical protein CALVIDRAFT_168550 [Calocera viscosa TUFC12733]|uniref:Uncharacterized protein n=1 Tax=Calocera viscosa (strain TUFC12733) TaxID=1330018 RepID=A0A167L693_CALVF|nr:hypothetical protein CALVIDRAFT_168550 [Calocera viscosa TUFC12733]
MLHFRAQVNADKQALTLQIQDLEHRRPTAARTLRLDRLRHQVAALDCDIHALPDDVLRHIFEIASEHGKCIKSSILVSHVCQRWRSVALATANIWSYIRLKLPFRRRGRGPAENFVEIVRRTANASVDLAVRVEYFRLGSMAQSVDILRKYLPSEEEYRMVTRDGKYAFYRLDFIPTSLATRLRSLTLLYYSSISSDRYRFKYLLDMLQRSPGIEKLDVHIDSYCDADTVGERVIDLPRLHELRLVCTSVNDSISSDMLCRTLLRCIEAPLLTLILGGGALRLSDSDWVRGLSFVGSLLNLKLRCSDTTELPTILRILLQLPRLERITLKEWFWVAVPASSLPSSPSYTTNLKKIKLDCVGTGSTRVLMEFLERHGLPRRPSDRKLHFTLHLWQWYTQLPWLPLDVQSSEEWLWLQQNVQTFVYEGLDHEHW